MSKINSAEDIIKLYINYKKNHIEYDLEDIMNKALSIYYDKELDELYIHKKKSIVIAMFMKDIHILLKLNSKKSIFCCKKKINIDDKISEYFYKHKIPIFINEILYIYRYRVNMKIEELSNHARKDDLLIFLKYEQNNNYIDLINNMTFEQKVNLMIKIINDIIYI